jgi:hypothetical protein
MSRVLNIFFALQLMFLTGCALALRPYNAPSTQKLSLQTQKPTDYSIRVAAEVIVPVPGDGRVSFEVPSLQHGCDAFLFGALNVRDGSPENVRAIHVIKGGKVVRKFSLSELGKLPVDSEGYHILVER